MRKPMLLAASVGLLCAAAQAQNREQSWDNLRTLRVGQKIQVVDQSLKSQEGTFVDYSDEAISLSVIQDEVSVQKADVLRVTSLKGMGRGKHTLIGLAVGAAGGLAIGLGFGSQFTESNEGLKDPRFLPAFVGLGTGIGAGIGAVLPPGHPTIYRAKQRD